MAKLLSTKKEAMEEQSQTLRWVNQENFRDQTQGYDLN